MKLTNGVIYNSLNGLTKLKNTELPIRTAYKLNKTFKVISEKVKFIEEQRNEIIGKYGKKDEKGILTIAATDEESMLKFINDFNEILSIEEEVEFTKLSIDELENTKLTPAELESVSWLLDLE